MQSFKELTVWQKSCDLVVQIYQMSRKLYVTDRALCSQIRRCAVSIPSNIAEGYSRNTTKDYMHFLYIARGSLAELETQLTLANRLGYLDLSELARNLDAIQEIGKMLNSLISSLGVTRS